MSETGVGLTVKAKHKAPVGMSGVREGEGRCRENRVERCVKCKTVWSLLVGSWKEEEGRGGACQRKCGRIR